MMTREHWIESLARRMRQRRFKHFGHLLQSVPTPIHILDVGGSERFWQQVGMTGLSEVSVTLLNIEPMLVTCPGFTSVVGDARDMRVFGTGEFDVVFTNSVIEHVGNYGDQKRMAYEVMRVGKRYYVQTPNRYFPIEPHFFLPFFQFYPHRLKVWIFLNMEMSFANNLGLKRAKTLREAHQRAKSIRLLAARELEELFPGGRVWRERLLGFTKSLVVYGGWDEV